MLTKYSTPNPNKFFAFERENIRALSMLKDLPSAMRKKLYDDVIVDDFIPTDTLLSFWAVYDLEGRLVDVDVLGVDIDDYIPESFGIAFSFEEVTTQLEFIYEQ
jgi:hypothetical protein